MHTNLCTIDFLLCEYHTKFMKNRSILTWGGILYILASLQYLAAQVIAASAWHPSYNWNANYISDLGNTTCGNFALPHEMPSYICSPDYMLMNMSFILIGILLFVGTILLKDYWPNGKLAKTGFVLLLIASIGKSLVGLVPENTILSLHTAAALNIPLGSIAILFLSIQILHKHKALAIIGFATFILGICATVLLIIMEYKEIASLAGLGYGGMERVAGYPMNIWMIIVGALAIREGRKHSSKNSIG